ncbi:hypothetical protein Tco_1489171 [Tanacetum coccineum]
MSNASHQQYYSQSSTTSPSSYVPPHFADNSQLDWGLSPMDNLIENLTNILSLLIQSYKTYLPQTNSQLRTSSNTRNHATVQDDRVVVQNVQDADEQPVQDLALNVDNMFQVDDCDAFNSDVDEAPTPQTKFMANLSSVDPIYDEAVRHMIWTFYMSNMIPYDQYAKDNTVPVVQSTCRERIQKITRRIEA